MNINEFEDRWQKLSQELQEASDNVRKARERADASLDDLRRTVAQVSCGSFQKLLPVGLEHMSNTKTDAMVGRVVYSSYRNMDSMLSIIVSGRHTEAESFCKMVVTALREYADAVERGNDGEFYKDKTNRTPKSNPPVCGKDAVEEMVASNGCEVRVIFGTCSKQASDPNDIGHVVWETNDKLSGGPSVSEGRPLE